jgi:3'-phosphoadenosine 5'-phosphosulfate sulfotransferase (PAPS reductase)/FAD synthetase
MTDGHRSDDDLGFHEQAIVTAMALHLTEHRHVVLSYSGGAESGLLLHLFRPFREGFTLVWNNPGALPHEAEHVRAQAAGGPFVEIPGDRAGYWKAHGLPSALVPASDMTVFLTDTPPAAPLSPFPACCAAVRWLPFHAWAAANGVTLDIHGQRHGENSPLFLPGPRLFDRWGPLASWSREEVMRRVAHHGVPLPRQYAEGYPTSIECAVCPANLAPARMAFLRDHYPAEHAETVRLAREVLRQVTETYEWQRDAVQAAALDAGEATKEPAG